MEDSVHLVTGGSRGLGRAIVERLASSGEQVVLTYRSDAAAAREVVAALDGHAHALPLDVRDTDACEDVVARIEEEHGPIVGLVNNAGILRQELLAMTSDADWEAVLSTNLGGVFRLCRAVLPRMMRRRGGSIVNVSSLSAIRGLPGQAAYAASKAGVVGLTRSLAREVGRRGIRANAVLPGLIETDLTAAARGGATETLRSAEVLPEGLTGAQVADVVAFLLSDAAAGITGQAIPVDAGVSA
ncbi:MAG: 3-oxoacyl-ACP reductase FabG [Thermoanaerobaculia bacterium]|nr:3-oxoacyl-ACP reductase FabG [Thermoanaerobaculia bacterium]